MENNVHIEKDDFIDTNKFIDINGIEEDNSFHANSANSDEITIDNVQSPELDQYRNLLNIFNEIELESINFKNEHKLDAYSFMKWLSLIVEEIGSVSQELNNFALHNNDVYEIRSKLLKLAATIITWIEMLNGNNPQSNQTNSQSSNSEIKKNTSINSSEGISIKMCPDCITYMFVTPKAFCNNLEHIKYSRN